MKISVSIQDSAQMSRDFYAVYPRDLLEDLAEEEPQLEQTAEKLDTLLAQKRQELKEKKENTEPVSEFFSQPQQPVKPVFVPDTLVVPGWDKVTKKYTKNWADFENLMYLYALDKLFTAETMPEKAKQDKKELTYVVEEFDRIKRPQVKKHLTAEKRLASTKTYLDFGKRTIDASCVSDASQRAHSLNDLKNEYINAMDGNEHNGWKLKKSYHIARRVMCTLRQRYF